MNRGQFLQTIAAVALAPWAEARALTLHRRRADFTFTRLQYASGDWDVDQRMPANLLNSLIEYTTVEVDPRERIVSLGSAEVFDAPSCYLAGHRLVQLTSRETRPGSRSHLPRIRLHRTSPPHRTSPLFRLKPGR